MDPSVWSTLIGSGSQNLQAGIFYSDARNQNLWHIKNICQRFSHWGVVTPQPEILWPCPLKGGRETVAAWGNRGFSLLTKWGAVLLEAWVTPQMASRGSLSLRKLKQNYHDPLPVFNHKTGSGSWWISFQFSKVQGALHFQEDSTSIGK